MKNLKNLLSFGIIILTILSLSIYMISCEKLNLAPKNIDKPDQIISIENAKAMYDSYTEQRVGIIKEYEALDHNDPEFDPTRYGWYDYATIKQYLAYIEQEAEKAGVEISGLQFYFTNYPNKNSFSDGSKIRYPKQNSFFIVPTMNIDGIDSSFLIKINEDGENVAITLRRKIQEIKNKNSYKIFNLGILKPDSTSNTNDSTSEDLSLILNESNLIPPPHQNTPLD